MIVNNVWQYVRKERRHKEEIEISPKVANSDVQITNDKAQDIQKITIDAPVNNSFQEINYSYIAILGITIFAGVIIYYIYSFIMSIKIKTIQHHLTIWIIMTQIL